MGLVGLNLTLTTPVLRATRSVLWPYRQARTHLIKALAPTWPAIILFGLVANTFNIVVFLKSGIKDNVTTLLFCLSVSDLAFLILTTPNMCYWILVSYVPFYQLPFHHRFIQAMFYWPAFTLYDLSAFISVSLGVTRCACVAMPLKFKSVFTKSRTIAWVLFLVVLAVSLRVPVLSIYRLGWIVDTVTNVSTPYLEYNYDHHFSMSRVNDIMNRGFVIWLNYITMIACVCILSFKLYEASKVRMSSVANWSKTSTDQAAKETPGGLGLSSRDLQVVKSIALICTIFILSQLPYLVISLTRLINADFNIGSHLLDLFGMFSDIARTFSVLNASVNIFVYYNYNSRYRSLQLRELKEKAGAKESPNEDSIQCRETGDLISCTETAGREPLMC